MPELIKLLLAHHDPAVQALTRWHLLNEEPDQNLLIQSSTIQGLLSDLQANGASKPHAYDKWMGAHWRLIQLAELGYTRDKRLGPLRKEMLDWLKRPEHTQYYAKRVVNGRTRMHPSVEGNFVWYSLLFDLHDDFVDHLVDTIIGWQWPDGGWNCDMKPHVEVSSFTETWVPARALHLYAQKTGDKKAAQVAREAAEVLLSRKLFRRKTNDAIIHKEFVQLHFPVYWHYDVLTGLTLMLEMRLLGDPRSAEALDLLESKQLADGGFPTESRYYRVADHPVAHRSPVDWGGASKKTMNPWVSIFALRVLKAAGRITF